MTPQHRSALALPLLMSLLVGCSSQNTMNAPNGRTAATSPDQAEVASAVAANPSYVDDEVSESPDQMTLGTTGGSAGALGATAAIRPITFWRSIRDVERTFEFAFSDTDSTGRPTTAVVTVHKLFRGTFNILVSDPAGEGNPPEAHVIHKPLVDHWVRRLLLKRVRLAADDRPVWRVAATSGVKITSRDADTRIVSLRIQSGALDTTITEPLAFFRLRAILKLDTGADLTLTATTLKNDDVVLLYLRDHRVRFQTTAMTPTPPCSRRPTASGCTTSA